MAITQTKDVPIKLLRADVAFQPREQGLNNEHLERLSASDSATWPPLLVCPNDKGGYDVIDGFHRLHVAREQGLVALRCEVVEGAGYPDAVQANLAHGLPLSIADRKAFARWLHSEDLNLSLRELARRSGLSDKTVKAALIEAESAENPQSDFSRDTPPPPDPVEKLVKLAAQAVTERTGVNRLAQFFSGKTDERQRAEYVRHVIMSSPPDERGSLAQGVTAMGEALIEGARAFLP